MMGGANPFEENYIAEPRFQKMKRPDEKIFGSFAFFGHQCSLIDDASRCCG